MQHCHYYVIPHSAAHRLRAGGLSVWTSRLPETYVELDEVRIESSGQARAMSRG
jgi:hypothetical protein